MVKMNLSSYFRGFTIIELLMVIMVTSIIASLAVPAYRTYMANNEATDLVTKLTAALRLAKSEAVNRSASISLCAISSAGGTNCNNVATNWLYGWQVVIPSSGTVLYTFQPQSATAVNVSPGTNISFSASGFPTPTTVTFTIKPTGCSRGFILNYSTVTSGELLQTTTVTCP